MTRRELPPEPAALVDALLEQAVEERATDLHFVPHPGVCRVRARIDGLLRDLHSLESSPFLKAVSRLKVLAEIDIAEKRRPQDGRLSHPVGDRVVDFRVSCIPTLHGESLVLRVLDRASVMRPLDELGLPPQELRLVRGYFQQPTGTIIVTGPTGAGKTTTLYAALRELATPERNVVSIEDPVEYEVAGVLQTSVQTKIGVTFAGLLRSILRHDPDVIMVGEVRDPETAEVSVRAALTGHLVLTTLHTPKAATAVSVYVNFGVRPYALAPALRGVLAQQLVREICPVCKTSFEYGENILDDPDIAQVLREGQKPTFSVGMGCEECFRSGYRGRRGIFELLDVNQEIQKRILRGESSEEVERAAVEGGMATLRRNGFRAVLEGSTTVEEVLRAVHVE